MLIAMVGFLLSPKAISSDGLIMSADGLDRFELPFFGGLASSFVDAE